MFNYDFFVIILFVSMLLMTGLPFVDGQTSIKSTAKISVNPRTIGLDQHVLINAWITPQPIHTGEIFHNLYVILTKPDGTSETIGPMDSETAGTIWFEYKPDQIGNWEAKLTWDGTASYASPLHEPVESPNVAFTVQTEKIADYPQAELPTGYWTRPITAEHREWWQISGAWTQTGRNPADVMGTCFNPYSTAPNTAHILWKVDGSGLSGLIGGEYGELSYGSAPSTVIMHGRVYYTAPDGLRCVDLRTGESLWEPAKPGTGAIYALPGPTPYIWRTSAAKFDRYNALTGALTKNVTGPGTLYGSTLSRTVMDGNGVFYLNFFEGGFWRALVKWDSNKADTTWESGIVWETIHNDLDLPEMFNPFNIAVWQEGGVIAIYPNGGTWTAAFDEATGELMWAIDRAEQIGFEGSGGILDGILVVPCSADERVYGYDIYTGDEVWRSEPADHPWGGFRPYQSVLAYGRYYIGNYDGHVYAYNVKDGSVEWKFYGGDAGYETPYGARPFYSSPAGADGKIYYANTEHSPTLPKTRGERLYCLNAETGEKIWSIAGCQSYAAISDGALVASDGYTSYIYCFDKGKTVTTISVSPKVASSGSDVLIEGTVMDLSPAQPNTPAITDEHMTEWMEHLHMQRGKPADIRGVPVKLTAIDQNGNEEDLGIAVSEASGLFSALWTPSSEGKYTIVANFEGSESYYSSEASTAIGVSVEASPTNSIASPSPVPNYASSVTTEIYIAITAVIIILSVIVGAMLLRKRK